MLTNRDYDLISGTLDDVLTDSERAEVESRLLRDAEFAAELNAIRRTITLVKTLPELTAPRDFRLTRAQAADIAREGAQIAWRPQRTSNVGRTFFLIMNAAASFILVLVGFLSLLGGSLNQQPLPSLASVAMLDDSANTLTPVATNGLPETFSVLSADSLTLTSESELPGSSDGAVDISPSPSESEFGTGGAGAASEEMSDAMMMMSAPEQTPAPDLSNAARSSIPPAPTQAMLTATDVDSEAFDTMMYDAQPTGTESDMGGQAFNTTPADDTMQLPAPVMQSTDEDAAEANNGDAVLATEATPKLVGADDTPQRGISPLGSLLLVIMGVSLGVVTMILRLRQP